MFLTEKHAYKLKKPAHGEGFDFRSVERRLRNALVEIRLNRRLAPEVYLGIVALTRGPDGALKLGGSGTPVDWLVKMVRLDAGSMLDRRLVERQLALRRIGGGGAPSRRLLRGRAAGGFDRAGAPRAKSAASCGGRSLRSRGLASLDCAASRRLSCEASMPSYRAAPRCFADASRSGGWSMDTAICAPSTSTSRAHRKSSTAWSFAPICASSIPSSEIAFLALECDRLGKSPIAHRLMRRYRERTGDRPPLVLFFFYTALNAVVRARLAVDHIAEPGTRSREEWIARAAAYLTIAAKACRRLNR